MDYGDVIYRHAAASVLKPLDRVNHSALRFITGDGYRTHHRVLYEKVDWSSLEERRNKHCFLYIFMELLGSVSNCSCLHLTFYSGQNKK